MSRGRTVLVVCSLCMFSSPRIRSQSTQGIISGRVMDSEDGLPIADAQIAFLNLDTGMGGTVHTDVSGNYMVPLLPPGKYTFSASKTDYQAQELSELELLVASTLEVNFKLRPLRDVWEEGQYKSIFLPGTHAVLTFYGPDIDTTHIALIDQNRGRLSPLETSVSTVVDPSDIRELPLAGRDVYAALVLQPGVTANTSTARGLGFSLNGQRPSSSNYLLDGVESNNYLATGPLMPLAPEAVQEYRVSINGFSAEYGRTSGFVANAVTRAGSSDWHGVLYFNLKNDVLNANTFQRNFDGLPRMPLKEDESGFQLGGPLRKGSVFHSTSFEYLRSRSFQAPIGVDVPTTDFLAFPTPDSIAYRLFQKYPPPPITASGDIIAHVILNPPASIDRYLGLERVDYASPKGAHRVMARLAIARTANPDFIWTPYTDFTSGLDNDNDALAVAWTTSVRTNLINELRGSWGMTNLQWNRRHPEIPTLAAGTVVLPGSPAFYAYKNHSTNWELLDNLLWPVHNHIVKVGAGVLIRRLDGYLTAGRDGRFLFQDLIDFSLDAPIELDVSSDRQRLGNYQKPDFNRKYRYKQFFFFAQDSLRPSPRLALNYGLRYENFGAPYNVGATKDAVVSLGPGASFSNRLISSQLIFPKEGDQSLYQPDNSDWSGRLGFAYSLQSNCRTLLRGAYGIFYDRPFDNLWQNLANNNFTLATASLSRETRNYMVSLPSLLHSMELQPFEDFPRLTMYQPNIRNGYSQSYFLGVQHQVSGNLTLELDAAGSLGRRLITTDLVNRALSLLASPELSSRRYNPALPTISYRSSQGISDYNALTALGRFRGRRTQFQIAYTWSHTIDNQSDPILNDFFDLSFTNFGAGRSRQVASFARQFDSRGDRGNSDFDQRHNLVFFSIWELPGSFSNTKAASLLRGWRISQIAAIRSGFPFSVIGSSGTPAQGGVLAPSRADVVEPLNTTAHVGVTDGVLLLNPEAFRNPAVGQQGNTGRNEFRGPGLYSIDLSLSRSIALKRLGESGRFIVRADAFNILNHSNLNNPDVTTVGIKGFGIGHFGLVDRNSGFPALSPFNETARQVQILLRVEF